MWCTSRSLNCDKDDKDIVVESYNLANNETIKVKDLARFVVDEMKLEDVKFVFTGGDRGWVGDVPVTILSIGKAKKLGWQTKISGEEAIRRTVRYHVKGDAT